MKTKVLKLGVRQLTPENRDAFFREAIAARQSRHAMTEVARLADRAYRDIERELFPELAAARTRVDRLYGALATIRRVQRRGRPGYRDALDAVLRGAIATQQAASKALRSTRDRDPQFRGRLELVNAEFAARLKSLNSSKTCSWGTYNAQREAHDRAIKAVFARRKQGLPSEVRFSSDPTRYIAAQIQCESSQKGTDKDPQAWSNITRDDGRGQARLLKLRDTSKGAVYELRIRTADGCVSAKVHMRGWTLPDDARVPTVRLVATPSGHSWRWHACITVVGSWPEREVIPGAVGYDWGHREGPDGSVRAYYFATSDGRHGEVRIPPTVRRAIDVADDVQAERSTLLDSVRSKLAELGKSRSPKRALRLIRAVPTTSPELLGYVASEKALAKREGNLRRKAYNIRTEVYRRETRALNYEVRAMEDIKKDSMKKLGVEGMTARRGRANRDLVAASEFERWSAPTTTVPARNTSKMCHVCNHINQIGSSVHWTCDGCGTSHDRDHNAAINIMRAALEKHSLTTGNNTGKE